MLKRTAAAAWLTARSHAVPARPVRPTGMELAVVIALAGTYGAALYGDARFVSVLDFIADYGAVALVQRVIAGARPETDFDVTTVATENGRLAEALREARVAFEFLCVTWLEVFLAETHALFEGLGVRIRTPDAHRVPPMSEGLDAEFRDPLAPLTRLFNLLITSIVERLGSTIDKRVAYNRELQRELDQFDLCQS
ncbi:hypothetical protein BH160DRAFT_1586 [Burkholderia sp. H160]|nr:hypothetical protein BH160DRAFT_1586 [Burkholderia sp. H160]